MVRRDARLLNFDAVEAIPAALARARANTVARALAHADWLVRRKSDGRFLAALQVRAGAARVHAFARPDAWPRDAIDGRSRLDSRERDRLVREIASATHTHLFADAGRTLPLTAVRHALATLGVSESYGDDHALALVPEPRVLVFAGRDRYRRPLFLLAPAAAAWLRMRNAAAGDGIVLDAISGYRSHAYQLGIFQRKRARGQSLETILRVNAAPGYSEHHGGCALDIGTPGEPPAEESFESTPAFVWLSERAGDFGFVLSYPRDNPHGIVYEPWHWRWGEE